MLSADRCGMPAVVVGLYPNCDFRTAACEAKHPTEPHLCKATFFPFSFHLLFCDLLFFFDIIVFGYLHRRLHHPTLDNYEPALRRPSTSPGSNM